VAFELVREERTPNDKTEPVMRIMIKSNKKDRAEPRGLRIFLIGSLYLRIVMTCCAM
jgi:hypothetical protein